MITLLKSYKKGGGSSMVSLSIKKLNFLLLINSFAAIDCIEKLPNLDYQDVEIFSQDTFQELMDKAIEEKSALCVALAISHDKKDNKDYAHYYACEGLANYFFSKPAGELNDPSTRAPITHITCYDFNNISRDWNKSEEFGGHQLVSFAVRYGRGEVFSYPRRRNLAWGIYNENPVEYARQAACLFESLTHDPEATYEEKQKAFLMLTKIYSESNTIKDLKLAEAFAHAALAQAPRKRGGLVPDIYTNRAYTDLALITLETTKDLNLAEKYIRNALSNSKSPQEQKDTANLILLSLMVRHSSITDKRMNEGLAIVSQLSKNIVDAKQYAAMQFAHAQLYVIYKDDQKDSRNIEQNLVMARKILNTMLKNPETPDTYKSQARSMLTYLNTVKRSPVAGSLNH